MIIIKFDNICFSSTPSKEKVSPQSNHQQEECNSVKYNLSEDGGGRGLFVSCTIHSQSDLISCTLKLECRRYCDERLRERGVGWLPKLFASLDHVVVHPHCQSIVASPLKVLNHFAVINTLIGARGSPFGIGTRCWWISSRSPRFFLLDARKIERFEYL